MSVRNDGLRDNLPCFGPLHIFLFFLGGGDFMSLQLAHTVHVDRIGCASLYKDEAQPGRGGGIEK